MNERYDAIVVGARCAGSPTARLLAQAGLSVLIVDRATFPSDTVSTHCITAGGCIQLQRWGLFERVLATNAPHVPTIRITMGALEMDAPSGAELGLPGTTSPRRTVLDPLLLDAALEAGADARMGVTVKALTRDSSGAVNGVTGTTVDGDAVELSAAVVVGADGVNSFVAREVGAAEYDVRETKAAGFYSYFSGWPAQVVELAIGDAGGVGVFPTNDEQVCVFAGRSIDEFGDYKRDVEGTHAAIVAGTSARLGEWLRGSNRTERFHGWSAVPGRFRTPFGDGWTLVGDAGYYKDPVTGHGITDAFRDAELLANAVVSALGGDETWTEALGGYQQRRDDMSRDLYHATQDVAQFDRDDAAAMDAFVRFGIAAQKEAMEILAFG